MKSIRRLIALAAVGALSIGLAPPAIAAPNDPVNVPDAGLQECIAYALGVAQAPSYTEAQLGGLTDLNCSSGALWTDVSALTGLERATRLARFEAYGSNLTDVTPLGGLPLTDLTLTSEQTVNLTPLANKSTLQKLSLTSYSDGAWAIPSLPALTDLELSSIPVSALSGSAFPKLTTLAARGPYGSPSDLSALPALPELTALEVSYTQVTRIPTLQMPKLTSFTARGAAITDIAGLSSLPALTTLDLRSNGITVIPNTLSLPKLARADLSWNKISSIAALPAMPALQRLDVQNNGLTTLPALNLPKLDWLGLAHYQITSVSATTKLPELDGISLVGNKLTNVGPLSTKTAYPVLSTVFVNGNQLTDLSNLGTTYRFKGQLHATRQRPPAGPTVKACTVVPLRTVKGAPDSTYPIVWDLPQGVVRTGSNIVYPEVGANRTYYPEYSQLGRFTRSDTRNDIYFSGYYSQAVTPATAILAPTPTISGSIRFGSRLTARAAWCPAATGLSYQWLRNGAPISRATGATYAPVLSDIGKKISVRVTGSRAGMTTVVKTSAQSVVAAGVLVAKTPSITGTAKKGKTLTAKTSAWTPAPVKISYQWLRNGKAISKATKSSYKLAKKDKGKYVSVRVTGSKTGYATASRTSAKTAKIK